MKRFFDPDATENTCPVHSVEISEAGDSRAFFTLWCKGQKIGQAFAAKHSLSDHHDPAVYHAGEGNYGWLPWTFPGKEKEGWSTHYHVDLPREPRWDDLAPFEIPPSLIVDIRGFMEWSSLRQRQSDSSPTAVVMSCPVLA